MLIKDCFWRLVISSTTKIISIDYNHAFDFNLNHFKYEGFHLMHNLCLAQSVHGSFSGLYNLKLHGLSNDSNFGINEGDSLFIRIPKALEHFADIKVKNQQDYTKCYKRTKIHK